MGKEVAMVENNERRKVCCGRDAGLANHAALNFEDGSYVDVQGQMRPMIEFSEDVNLVFGEV
jgi:hypothetical protein